MRDRMKHTTITTDQVADKEIKLAHQKGYDVRNGNDEDRTKEYQQRLDNFVKIGKSKEFVPENQKNLQF